jgi:hypothetical protein
MEADCPPRNIQDARNLAGRFTIGCPTKHRYLGFDYLASALGINFGVRQRDKPKCAID